jgi:KUP system potassium uptake protein
MLPFLLIDLTFLGANLLKVFSGGWVPLLIGGMVMVVMLTWRRGARILAAKTRRLERPIESLIQTLDKKQPFKVPGTAAFLTADPSSAPTALLHSLKHYKVLHEQNVVANHHHRAYAPGGPGRPHHTRAARQDLYAHTDPFRLHGEAEHPEGTRARAQARLELRHHVDLVLLVAPVGRPDPKSGMPVWQDRLFIILAKNADDASSYFQLPTDRVVEIGTQVTV